MFDSKRHDSMEKKREPTPSGHPTQPNPPRPTLPNATPQLAASASAGASATSGSGAGFVRAKSSVKLVMASVEGGRISHIIKTNQNKRKNLKMIENCLKVGLKPPTKSLGKSLYQDMSSLSVFLSPSQKRITFSAKLRQWWKTPSCPANGEIRWQISRTRSCTSIKSIDTPLGTNISPLKGIFEDHSPFPQVG